MADNENDAELDDEIESDEDIKNEGNESNHKIINQIIIKDRVTPNILSVVELIKVLCVRTDDINNGAMPYITTNETSSWLIALHEIMEGKCPLTVIRSLGVIGCNDYVEIWKVNELIITPKCIANITDVIERNKSSISLTDELNKLIN